MPKEREFPSRDLRSGRGTRHLIDWLLLLLIPVLDGITGINKTDAVSGSGLEILFLSSSFGSPILHRTHEPRTFRELNYPSARDGSMW